MKGLYISSSQQPCGVGIIIPISKMRTPRLREVKELRQDQSPKKQQSCDSKTEAIFLSTGSKVGLKRSLLMINVLHLDIKKFQSPGSLSFGTRPSIFPLLDSKAWVFDHYAVLLLSGNVFQVDSWNHWVSSHKPKLLYPVWCSFQDATPLFEHHPHPPIPPISEPWTPQGGKAAWKPFSLSCSCCHSPAFRSPGPLTTNHE